MIANGDDVAVIESFLNETADPTDAPELFTAPCLADHPDVIAAADRLKAVTQQASENVRLRDSLTGQLATAARLSESQVFGVEPARLAAAIRARAMARGQNVAAQLAAVKQLAAAQEEAQVIAEAVTIATEDLKTTQRRAAAELRDQMERGLWRSAARSAAVAYAGFVLAVRKLVRVNNQAVQNGLGNMPGVFGETVASGIFGDQVSTPLRQLQAAGLLDPETVSEVLSYPMS